MREYEEVADKGSTQKFSKRMRRLTKGFKNEAYSCRILRGDLATDDQSILDLGRSTFSSLLSTNKN